MKFYRMSFFTFFLLFSQLSLPLQPALSGYTKIRYTWDEKKDPQMDFSLKDVRLKNTLNVTELSTLVVELNITSKVVLKEGYVQLKREEGTLRFGQFKIPFGYEMPLSGALLETPTIPTVFLKLFPNQTYDQGLIWVFGKKMQFALVNGTGENTPDNDNAKDLVLRFSDKDKFFSYGASVYLGKQKQGDKDWTKNRWGMDFILNKGKGIITSEVIWGRDGEEDSKGWYIKYRYNLPSLSYIIKYEYYEGVDSFDTKMGKWGRMEEKAFIFGPMFYLDKNTILSIMCSRNQGREKKLVLQLQVNY